MKATYEVPTITQRMEHDIIQAVRQIRSLWPALIMESKAVSNGGSSTDDISSLDRRISLREEITTSLAGWARLIITDRHIERPMVKCRHRMTMTLHWPYVGPTLLMCSDGQILRRGLHDLTGTDLVGLCDFLETHAQWLSWHEAAEAACDEIMDWSAEVMRIAVPVARDWLVIGDCPFIVGPDGSAPVDGDDVTKFCPGVIRGYPDGRDPHCTRCHQSAIVEWWQEVLDATERYVTAEGLVRAIHRTFGRPVKAATVRLWVHRQWIRHAGEADAPMTSATGANLFDLHEAVPLLARRFEGAA